MSRRKKHGRSWPEDDSKATKKFHVALLSCGVHSGHSVSPAVSTGSRSSTAPAAFDRKPLLFLYDCETTGLNCYEDRIIEIASVVLVPDNAPSITQAKFSSLCHTSRQSNPKALKVHGITAEMLADQPPFHTVFTQFSEWIEQCVQEACGNNAGMYYPVLVAHYGFKFDYPILMAEIRRCNLKESFKKVDLWFADTWYDADRLRNTDPVFLEWSKLGQIKLGMKDLFHKCFPEEAFQGHRAMADVQNMKRIFTTKFSSVLEKLTFKTKEEIQRKS